MLGLLGDKKKISQIILSEHAKKPEEKEVPQGIEADFSKAHDAFSGDIIKGIQSGDPGMVTRSLKGLIKLCLKEDEYSDPEGE